jgi:hypothetical protein
MADRNTQNPAGDSDLKQKLKDGFSDGKIPTGANFGELIEAFALEAELAEVEARVDTLEHPANGTFTETVAIGEKKDTWTIRALDSGSLELRPEADNTGAWVQVPARIGSLQPYAETDRLAEIAALGLEPTGLNGRDQILVSPRPGPFAVEVVATVEPAPPEQAPDASRKSLFSRIYDALARPPVRTSIIRATAISAGEETPPRIDQRATPLTTFRVAATRAVIEFLLILGLIFILADNINSEIQQIPREDQDDWFEKSFPITVKDSIACPVMSALAAVKLYKMPKHSCPASASGGENTGDTKTGETKAGEKDTGGDTKPANGDTSASDPKSGDEGGKSDTTPPPTPSWEEQLTGESPVNSSGSDNTPAAPVTPPSAAAENPAAGSVNASSAKADNGKKGTADVTGGGDRAATGGVVAGNGDDPPSPTGSTTYNTAYSAAGLVIIALLLFLRFRSIPMWFAMRRGLIVRWVKNPKAAGGLTLMLQRRGVLSAQNAKVRCHMTQLWG